MARVIDPGHPGVRNLCALGIERHDPGGDPRGGFGGLGMARAGLFGSKAGLGKHASGAGDFGRSHLSVSNGMGIPGRGGGCSAASLESIRADSAAILRVRDSANRPAVFRAAVALISSSAFRASAARKLIAAISALMP